MGISLSLPQISLIILGCVLLSYSVGVGIYIKTNTSSTQPPLPPLLPNLSPETMATPSATSVASSSNSTSTPTFTSTITPTVAPMPHLEFDSGYLAGPPNTPSNFYRLGCQAAFSEGLFPFSNFNTTGTLKTGIIQDYFSYDKWGYGGGTGEYDCGWTLTKGKNTCPPDPKPNIPWTDEQCDICATASKDPSCIWTESSSDCYRTLLRNSNNVTFVPTYHGMDISQCYYSPQGLFNDNKLCCDPAVS